MNNIITEILNKQQLTEVKEILVNDKYTDGRITAGVDAIPVKYNNQTGSYEAAKLVMPLMLSNKQFLQKSFYKVVCPPLFAKYTPGMYYGPHVDDPLMRTHSGMVRTDLAMTLFLNDPDEYEGGELCTRDNTYKLSAGSLILYPADTIHHVNPVTSGVRHVMVTWCQSIIRYADQRQILDDLENFRHSSDKVDSVYNNLVRMWADV